MTNPTDLEQSRFLAEYLANVDLWKHDDTLRQQRAGTFLGVNTALLAALGVVMSLNPPDLYIGIIGLLFAAFGLIVSVMWHKVQVRNAEYIRFRRFQLRAIELMLPGLSTFRNVFAAFYEHQPIIFQPPIGKFVLEPEAQTASTSLEGRLPCLIGLFWLIAAGTAFFLFIVAPILPLQPPS